MAGYSNVDVLFGNAKIHTQHSGNLRLKEIETDRLAEYEAAPRILEYGEEGKSKKDINREILNAIKANGGRFLRRNKATGVWEAVSDHDAIEKILRDFSSLRKKRSANWATSATHPPHPSSSSIEPVTVTTEGHNGDTQETNNCSPRTGEMERTDTDQLPCLSSKTILRERSCSMRDTGAKSDARLEEEVGSRTRQKLDRRCELDLIKEISTASSKVTDEIELQFRKLKEEIDKESAVERLVSELAERSPTPENGNVMVVAGGYGRSGSDILIEAMRRYPCNEKVSALANLSQKDSAAKESENTAVAGATRTSVPVGAPSLTMSGETTAALPKNGSVGLGLRDADFPIGAKRSHPGRIALTADIDACVDEYLLADVGSPRTTPEGRILRSKKQIIAHVLALLYGRGGRVKQKQKDGQWAPIQCERATCSGCRNCEKLHTKIRDQIKARIRKFHGGGAVRTVVAARLEGKAPARSPVRKTDEPSVLSFDLPEAGSMFSFTDVSALYSLTELTFRDDLMSAATKQQPQQSDRAASAAVEPAPTSVSGDLSFMSISESGKADAVAPPLRPSTMVAAVSENDPAFPPFNVVIDDDDDSASSRGSTNTVENVSENLSRMYENKDDVRLVEEVIDALAGEIAKYYGGGGLDGGDPDIRRGKGRPGSAVNAESVTLLLDTANAHPKNLSIQRNCCLILRNLARSRDNLGAISGAGSAWLVEAMQRAPLGNEEIQRFGSHALGNLALNDSNRIAIGNCGGIAVVTDAMRNFPNEAWLQRYSCEALGNLARGTKGEMRQMIKEEGGVTMLVAAMSRFSVCAGLQQSCLRAFGNLAKDEPGREAVLEADGIRLTVTALNKFKEKADEGIQESGCRAFCNLSMSETGAVTIVDLSGIQCITNAMKTYDANEDVARYGCCACFHITRGSLKKVQAKGLLIPIRAAVRAAMDKFPLSKHVRKYGKKTLRNTDDFAPTGFSW